MTAKNRPLPEWDRVLSAASRLQQMVPDAVLVGGRAVALHTKHRQSEDADHGITNLRDQFDAILADLEQVSGWKTARTRRPVLILGSLDGIMTGVRQLIVTFAPQTRSFRSGIGASLANRKRTL